MSCSKWCPEQKVVAPFLQLLQLVYRADEIMTQIVHCVPSALLAARTKSIISLSLCVCVQALVQTFKITSGKFSLRSSTEQLVRSQLMSGISGWCSADRHQQCIRHLLGSATAFHLVCC